MFKDHFSLNLTVNSRYRARKDFCRNKFHVLLFSVCFFDIPYSRPREFLEVFRVRSDRSAIIVKIFGAIAHAEASLRFFSARTLEKGVTKFRQP